MFEHTRILSFPQRYASLSGRSSLSHHNSIPLSVHSSPASLSLEFTDPRTPPPAGLQYKSSPLVSVVTSSPIKAEPAVVTHRPKTEAKPEIRPDTVYDEEDAYGGI